MKQWNCKFMEHSVEYLDHVVDADGLHKVEAIIDAPITKDITELRAFLGLLNYYSKFLENSSHKLHPLTLYFSRRFFHNLNKSLIMVN